MRAVMDGDWKHFTYAEVGRRVNMMAAALIRAGIKRGDKVAIFSQNRPEWAWADYAALTIGAIVVPLYATSTPSQVRQIMADAGVQFAFVGGPSEAERVDEVWDEIPTLTDAAAFEPTDSPRYPTYGDLEIEPTDEEQAEIEARLAEARADDVATIIYTSGTTAEPKGVVLPHSNFFHQMDAVQDRYQLDETDRSLCFLPLSHVFERAWSYYVMALGAENVYVLDPKAVASILPLVKPTMFVSVPRLYEKVVATAKEQAESGLKKKLFDWSIAVGNKAQHAIYAKRPLPVTLRIKHRVAKLLVLNKLLRAIGGPKRVMAAGGAPLRKEVEEFWFSFGALVSQGYGLTETSPMLTCNAPEAFKFGTVGRPVLGCEIRIAEDGEILARGPNIMREYYNNPEETAKTLVDGWLHTGDIGHIDEDGYVVVTDRIKDIIITSYGKNVAPQPIEGRLMADPFIEQAIVIGDRRSYLTALIQPAYEQVEAWARKAGIAFENREALLQTPRILTMFNERVKTALSELMQHEQVHRFKLLANELTMESGLLTPTLKVRRQKAEAELAAEIDEMYEEPSPEQNDSDEGDAKE